MKIGIRKLILSSLFMGAIPHSAFAANQDIKILWHRVCSRWTQDPAVYMPHNKKAEAPLRIIIAPDASLYAPENSHPLALQVALYEALHVEDALSIEVPSVVMNGRVVYPLLESKQAVLQVDADRLNQLQVKYKALGIYVVNDRGMILGSSNFIPRGIRYDEDKIGLVSRPNEPEYQVLKKEGGYLVTVGFQSIRGTRQLTVEDLRLGALCDESVTPLLVNFSGKDPEFIPAEKGVAFKLVPDKNVKVSWPQKNQDVAWIVRDLNANGQIESGREMFGSETEVGKGVFATNGFAALALLDQNKNGVLEGAELKELQLWFDKNANGVSDAGELIRLAERISEISLDARLNEASQETQVPSAPLVSEAKGQKGEKFPVLDYLLKTIEVKK